MLPVSLGLLYIFAIVYAICGVVVVDEERERARKGTATLNGRVTLNVVEMIRWWNEDSMVTE